jgi:hypothetical protein
MSEQVTFTPQDAQRIANTVLAHEKGQKTVKEINLDIGDITTELVVVQVTGNIVGSFYPGTVYSYEPASNLYTSTGITVAVKEVNGRILNTDEKYLGKFHGLTTFQTLLKPVVLVDSYDGGGNATIEVVTDVVCTPQGGLEVSTITLAGSNYDTAVIKKFLSLTDVTPKSFLGNQGRVVKVNDNATALEFGPIVDASYTTFIALSDTPASYGTTNTYKTISVNSTNNGMVFSDNLVNTTKSVTGGGNPNNPNFVSISLINDQASPGNNKFYGTTNSGVKGFRSINLEAIQNWANMTGCAGCVVIVNQSANGVEFINADLTQMLADIADLKTRVAALEGA